MVLKSGKMPTSTNKVSQLLLYAVFFKFLRDYQHNNSFIYLRTDSSRRGPFLFFFDYIKSIQDRITYCTSFESLYYSLPTDVNNNIVIYVFKKISSKNIIFLLFFEHEYLSNPKSCILEILGMH